VIDLSNLTNTDRPKKNSKRLGRGIGSHKGKTSGRGQKGGGSRAGYRRRWGNEGGQLELFRKLPCKGFSNMQFKVTYDVVNLGTISEIFQDGDVVSFETLVQKGYISGSSTRPLKLLAKGELTKKVTIEVDAISASAKAKLDTAGISYVVHQIAE
jgi:large subunit ribosomal protein L15